MKKNSKKLLIILCIILIVCIVFYFFNGRAGDQTVPISLNELQRHIETKTISQMTVFGDKALIETIDGVQKTTLLPKDTSFIHSALFHKINIKIEEPSLNLFSLKDIMRYFIEYGLWFLFIMWIGRRSAVGQSNRGAEEAKPNVKLADVAGMKDIKVELLEILETMKSSDKYAEFGCTVPKGAILYGPPGNGKTYIAKALAGEARTSFISRSASEFIEIYVGTGPSRVRELFKKAREMAPCIIFIDEIDALGSREKISHRSGAGSETHNTINELLVQMDGIQDNELVFVFFATNRIEDLDKALLRAGRIDRKVLIGNPDYEDRLALLRLLVGKIHAAVDMDLEKIAKGSLGFSRAEITTLVNESKFRVVRDNARVMTMRHLEETKDSMILGAKSKKRGSILDVKNTAYHECGHAFGFYHFRNIVDPIYKATIVPRGHALGVVMTIPDEDRVSMSKEYIEAQIIIAFAGRIAEEIFFGNEKVTAGCSSDIAAARKYAEMYVRYGMSDDYGLVFFNSDDLCISEKDRIADEIRKLMRRLEQETRDLLLTNKSRIERLTKILLEVETLTGPQIAYILENDCFLPVKSNYKRNIYFK